MTTRPGRRKRKPRGCQMQNEQRAHRLVGHGAAPQRRPQDVPVPTLHRLLVQGGQELVQPCQPPRRLGRAVAPGHLQAQSVFVGAAHRKVSQCRLGSPDPSVPANRSLRSHPHDARGKSALRENATPAGERSPSHEAGCSDAKMTPMPVQR